MGRPTVEIAIERKQFGYTSPLNPTVHFWIFQELGKGRMACAVPLVLEEVPEGADPEESTGRMSMEQSQRLIDRLWDIGLRPSEGTGSAGSLAATERHLKDMQRLVFKDG